MLQQVIYTNKPVPMAPEDLAVDAIGEVGPFGHFFGAEHTASRYRDAFYQPMMSDWRNYETWEETGAAVDAPARQHRMEAGSGRVREAGHGRGHR